MGDDVGRFAGSEQRAAPEHTEAMRGCALGKLVRLGAAGLVERHGQMALEAPLVVVGGLPVAGEIDADGSALGQDRSKRSRSMTFSQAAAKSRTNFSPASAQA